MAKSLIVAASVALKQEGVEDLPNLLKRRFGSELGNGKRVGSLRKLIDLIVVRQLKSDFHSVHGDGAGNENALSQNLMQSVERA